jgi:pyrimidine-nucleoside phosphorylase
VVGCCGRTKVDSRGGSANLTGAPITSFERQQTGKLSVLIREIIEKKRDGLSHSPEEIQEMIRGVSSGTIPDYQLSAWLMAIICRGMDESETAILTESMLGSGARLKRCSEKRRVDKHSTGGLGDKTSLILAPLLACMDVDVPMLSGRGLGITGGTLDKLESYSGLRTTLSQVEISQQLSRIGCVITGTTSEIAPADQRLYALRDVTGTVPSVALITASIMCKKLAESLDALVLDVKWGSGAFMRTPEGAQQLQDSLVRTGRRMGVCTESLISDMNQPLGLMVGNACEVNEAIQVLQGGGPEDTRSLTLALAAKLLVASGTCGSPLEAVSLSRKYLEDGRALDRFRLLVEAQGGTFTERLPTAHETVIISDRQGWIGGIDCLAFGNTVIEMGGGRKYQGDRIDHRVGLELLCKIGDPLQTGQPMVRLFYDGNSGQVEKITQQLQAAFQINSEPVSAPSLIQEH